MVEMKVSELMAIVSSAFPLDYKMRWQKLEEMVKAAEQNTRADGTVCPIHGLKKIDGYCPSLTCIYSPPNKVR